MTESSSKSSCIPRLGMCEVCAAKEARYACPKCEVKTCCLACVQIHKKELACDGQRDRTKFVPLSQMTAREFMSDYCFLEEATRYAEARKSDRSKRFTHDNNGHNRGLSVPQHRLRTAAYWRNIRLQLQQANFSRHKENTTYLDWKLRRLFWRVEWLFVNIPIEAEKDDGQVQPVARFVDARCDEHETLANLALKYVDLQQETARNNRKRLTHHQTAGIGQLSFWLRAEGVPRCATSCYALEAATPLGKNLAGKTIVEFPTIYVTYEPKPPLGLEVIESDLELKEETSAAGPPAAKKAKKEEQLEAEDRSQNSSHESNSRSLSVPSQHRLRKPAYWRNIRLQLQQPNLSRHKENTTYLDWKLRRLFWRVEWLFVNIPTEAKDDDQAEPVARFVDARCDEHETLANLAVKYVDLQQETARNNRKRLTHHQMAGIGQLRFWLRAENIQGSVTGCFELEATTPLGKNLAGKTIVEFPTIYVTYEPKPPLGIEVIESDNLELEEEASESASEEEADIDVFHGIATAFASEDDSEAEAEPEEEDDLAIEEQGDT